MKTVLKEKKSIRPQLDDIITDISWAKVSKKYFNRSPSWIYHKIDGIGNNGEPGGFTDEELKVFKTGLLDLAERIKAVADTV